MGLLINLDIDSFREVSLDASQVMVYGYSHCKYLSLIYTLKHSKMRIVDKVLECSIGNDYHLTGYKLADSSRASSENRVIHQFQTEPLDEIMDVRKKNQKFCSRAYKMGVLNLVFENFLRQKRGLAIIPFIVVLDVSNNRHPYNPQNIASSDDENNNIVTHSVLRRCYKLVNIFPDAGINEIAAQTFRFTKLDIQDDVYYLKTIEPFWFDLGWKAEWEQRNSHPNPHKFFKTFPWEKQLLNALERINAEESSEESASSSLAK